MKRIVEHLVTGFREAAARRSGQGRRVGSELKFPLVNARGEAAPREAVAALWAFLVGRGWEPAVDPLTGRVVGATMPGEHNDTIASCETGYCKPEFSLAHVGDLGALRDAVERLRHTLRAFSDREGVRFLGYGIQPKTPPSKRLLIRQSRTAFWGRAFRSNRAIAPRDGDDVHLFTINASSQVHVDVAEHEAVPAVNALNGLTAAQIALTADSSVWRGCLDPEYKCVCEMFWDWWMPQGKRVGIPAQPFTDLTDYIHTVARLRPVYVKRDGKPVGIMDGYRTFVEYYQAGGRARGVAHDGRDVPLTPCPDDIDQHATFYWYNARLSRYYTVENRVNDQQPPDELLCVPALTLGLLEALPEAVEIVASYAWNDLAAARTAACREGLEAIEGGVAVDELAGRMLGAAQAGLERRGLGEEQFLEPLWQRLKARRCPADAAADTFAKGGVEALVAARRI